MAAAEGRLSGLPDDLLRRVLRFAPAKVAVSTSLLSRRWRSLWRSSGALNIETLVYDEDPRPYGYCGGKRSAAFFFRRDLFVSSAKKVLVAGAGEEGGGGCPVTRLALRLECESSDLIETFLHDDGARSSLRHVDVLAGLLSLPAARGVEELQLSAAEDSRRRRHPTNAFGMDSEVGARHIVFPVLGLHFLPSNTLRALDVAGCKALTPAPAGFALPRLESLRLSRCGSRLEHLQGLIDAAPALAAVHLESVMLEADNAWPVHLRCSAATTLVLDKCSWAKEEYLSHSSTAVAVVIEAPRLRRFTYKGLLREISLNPQAPDLARVDLHILPRLHPVEDYTTKDLRRAAFWRLIHSFSNVKQELKLRVNHLEEIAVATATQRAELLRPLNNLRRLELEGVHRPRGSAAAVTIANLLRCCPVIHDLRINLTTAQGDSIRKRDYGTSFLKRKYRNDLDKSVYAYGHNRCGSEHMVSLDPGFYDEVADLPALSGRVFPCLQSSLRCVSLQFRQEKTDCFGVKLIKFFAEKGTVLEEMRIDGGNGKMSEHVNCKVETWVADSSKKMKAGLRVLPLERSNQQES